jgi:drug/metabolite transporter (DMT)-like permease
MNQKSDLISGYLLVIGTAFFTAFSYIFGKMVSTELHPETVTFYWFLGAFIVALINGFIYSIFNNKFKLIPSDLKDYKTVTIISSVITIVSVAFWVVALRTAGPPVTSFLMKFQVVFSVLLGFLFLNEKVITYNASNFEFRGSLYAIISAFGYSCLFMIVKKMGRNLNMMMVAVLRSVGVSLLIGIYLLCFNKFQLPSSIDLLYMFIGGTCGAYVGKAFQFQAIKLVDISRTTAITPLEAVFVLILTYIFFETVPSTIKLIGGAIILVGVLTLIIFSRRKQN